MCVTPVCARVTGVTRCPHSRVKISSTCYAYNQKRLLFSLSRGLAPSFHFFLPFSGKKNSSLSRTRTVLPVDTPTVDERVVQPMLNPNRNQVRKEPRNGHGLRYTAGHPCGCVIERIHASRGEKEKAGPKNAPTSCLPAAIPSLSAQNTTFPWTHERARSRGVECMLVKGSCSSLSHMHLSAQNTTFPWTRERARSRGAECMLVKGSCSSLSHMHLASTLALHMTLSTLLKHKTLL